MSNYPWYPNNSSTSSNISDQTETTYEQYKKIKSFVEIGFFLMDYVVSGGVVTKDVYQNNRINVSDIVASLKNDVTYSKGTSFKTRDPNTTYYLDYLENGKYYFDTKHHLTYAYLPIAEVSTDQYGNVVKIVDKRGPVGGFRLKNEFNFPDVTEINSKLSQIQVQIVLSQVNNKLVDNYYKNIQYGETPKTLTLCMQGDSLTAGNGANPGGDIPNRIRLYLNAMSRPGQSVNMINRGVGGDTAKMSNERWTTPSGADLTIIMLGTNDYNKVISMEEFNKNYEEIIQREIKNGTAVVLVTPPQWGSKDWLVKPSNGSLLDYAAAVKKLGLIYSCPVLDIFKETKNLGTSAYKAGEAVPHIHLNDVGYQLISQKLTAFVGFQHPATVRKMQNGSFLGVRPAVDAIKMPSAYYFIDQKPYYPTPAETTSGMGTGIKTNDNQVEFYYAIYANEDNLCLIPSFNFTKSDGTEYFDLQVNNNNMPVLPSDAYMYSNEVDRSLISSRLTLTMNGFPRGKVTENITQNVFKDSSNIFYYRVLPTKGWYVLKVTLRNCEFHGFDILNKMALDSLTKLSRFTDTGWIPLRLQNGATNAGPAGEESAYRVEKRGTLTQVFIRLNIIGNADKVFATLPSNLIRKSVMRFPVFDSTDPTMLVIGTTGNMVTSPATQNNLLCDVSYVL